MITIRSIALSVVQSVLFLHSCMALPNIKQALLNRVNKRDLIVFLAGAGIAGVGCRKWPHQQPKKTKEPAECFDWQAPRTQALFQIKFPSFNDSGWGNVWLNVGTKPQVLYNLIQMRNQINELNHPLFDQTKKEAVIKVIDVLQGVSNKRFRYRINGRFCEWALSIPELPIEIQQEIKELGSYFDKRCSDLKGFEDEFNNRLSIFATNVFTNSSQLTKTSLESSISYLLRLASRGEASFERIQEDQSYYERLKSIQQRMLSL